MWDACKLSMHEGTPIGVACSFMPRELKVATGIIKILNTKNEPFMCHLQFIKIINGLQKVLGLGLMTIKVKY